MKTFCPLCSHVLLRHLERKEVSWFCLRCHQEMPNINLIEFNNIQQKICKSDRYLDNYENTNIKCPIDNIYKTIQYQFNTIDLCVDRNQKRLKVVSFIMNKIDLLLINTFGDRQSLEIELKSASSKAKYQTNKTSTFIKAKFLRDSELILLRICYAILVSDISILNDIIQQELRSSSINSNFQIEKTYLIDLIKILVIDFIKTITLDTAQNIECFTAEISGYFEIVIESMLDSSLENVI